MITDNQLKAMRSLKDLQDELHGAGLDEAAAYVMRARRELIKTDIEREISSRMRELDKEDE